MKPPFLLVGTIVILAIPAPAAEQESAISKETARNAITIFRQDPLSPRGRAAGEMLRSFAEKSQDVILQISPKVAPFLTNMKVLQPDRTLLLDAFIVGEVDSQLLRNEKKDDPYAGVLEVIETYRQMQKRNPALQIPEIENFIDLGKRGELKSYVSSP